MVNRIEGLLQSFIFDFDIRKLERAESILYSLLVKKECLLLENKANKTVKQLEILVNRYHDLRGLVYKRLLRTRMLAASLLEERIFQPPERLIVLLTHRCQLRCRYCRVKKYTDSMDERVLRQSIDLLFTSNRRHIQLQFFGGEPLLRFDLIKKAVAYARSLKPAVKKTVSFLLTTNGICLTKETIDYFSKHNFCVECSIDGEIQRQLKNRGHRNENNYYDIVTKNFSALFDSTLPHYSISVFMPQDAGKLFESFKYLVKLGFKKLQANYALGVFWPDNAVATLFKETAKIARYLRKHKEIKFLNFSDERKEPVVLNAELTVDCNGEIFRETGICLEEDFKSMKKKFFVTDVKKAGNINLLSVSPLTNFYLLSRAYGAGGQGMRKIILNNINLGSQYSIFIKKLWI
ncbi:MAG: radical SAM protein [Candidatus Omnitrophota bacterium]|jgi:sulfatase maturation enzyme AslB (radical SAM superfamily)